MGSSGGEPRILLNALKPMLSLNGDIKTPQEVMRIVGLMKDAEKLMSRCIYLNILRATCLAAKGDENKKETLQKFLVAGGWGVLNKWLLEFSKNENFPVLLELIEVLKNMPITVDLLKQGNTGKLIKQMTKLENAELKRSAMLLIRQWKDMIRGGSGDSAEKRKPGMLNGELPEEMEKKIDENGIQDENASPSGKRNRENHSSNDKAQPPEKKLKTTSGKAQAKVKMIEPVQKAVESSGFMNALAVATTTPVIKKKKKSPVATATTTANKPSLPLDEIFSRQNLEKAADKDSGNKKGPATSNTFPAVEPNTDQEQDTKVSQKSEGKEPVEVQKDEKGPATPESKASYSTRTGKKKKSVRWAADESICQTFFFEIDEAERASMHHNVNFSDAKQMELLRERKALATAKRLSEDRMVERVPWRKPLLIDCAPYPINIGDKSIERVVQNKREQNVLADIFLTKASLPDSPSEPDVEIEDQSKKEPTLIPHDEAGNLYPTHTTHHPTTGISVAPIVSTPVLEMAQGAVGLNLKPPEPGFVPMVFNNQLKGVEPSDHGNMDTNKLLVPASINMIGGPRKPAPNNSPSSSPLIHNHHANFKPDVTSTVHNILTHLRGNNIPGNQQDPPVLPQHPELLGGGQGLLGAAPSLPEEPFVKPPIQSLLGIAPPDRGHGRSVPHGNTGRGSWGGPRGGPRGHGQGQFHGNNQDDFEERFEEDFDEPGEYGFHGRGGGPPFGGFGHRGRGNERGGRVNERGRGGERGRNERGRGRGFGESGFGNDRGFDRARGGRGRGLDRGRGFNDRNRGRGERGRGRGRETKGIVCRHFMQRGCRNGANCMFLHPGVH